MSRSTSASGRMLEAEWRRDSRRIVIPVTILIPWSGTEISGLDGKALLDTGSTTSGVTKSVAERLGLIGRGKRPLGSAQGLGQAERYLFRIGIRPTSPVDALPRFPFVFDEVMGFELTNSFQWEALIGMDILSQCDFSMGRSGHCSLRFG